MTSINALEEDGRDLREMKDWAKNFQNDNVGGKKPFYADERGGHMELQKASEKQLIGPTYDEVQKLLVECGKKLGMDYVAR